MSASDLIGLVAKLADIELGKRQIAFMLICLACASIVVAVYERHTSGFRFSKLEKATALLTELNSLDPNMQSNEKFKNVHSTILASLEEVVGRDATSIPKHSRTNKFAGGMWPWVLLSLLTLSKDANGRRTFTGFWGFICMGALVSAFCMFLPEFKWPWSHWLLYPVAAVVIVVTAVMIGAIRSEARKPIIVDDAEASKENGEGAVGH